MPKAHKKPAEPVRIDIKKEDTVKVTTGRDKGKTGRVLRVDRETGRILVEHVMLVGVQHRFTLATIGDHRFGFGGILHVRGKPGPPRTDNPVGLDRGERHTGPAGRS